MRELEKHCTESKDIVPAGFLDLASHTTHDGARRVREDERCVRSDMRTSRKAPNDSLLSNTL